MSDGWTDGQIAEAAYRVLVGTLLVRHPKRESEGIILALSDIPHLRDMHTKKSQFQSLLRKTESRAIITFIRVKERKKRKKKSIKYFKILKNSLYVGDGCMRI